MSNLSSSRLLVVSRALAYLQVMSVYNSIRRSVLRVRQPKYLLGMLAGAGYLYFFIFRHFFGGGGTQGDIEKVLTAEMLAAFPAIAALVLLLFVFLDWLFAGRGAKLGFSETEIDFLFPAPLTRTALIQYSLLRTQLSILFSAVLLTLLLNRGVGHPVQYVLGLWLVMSVSRLYLLAASFTRERLLHLGLGVWPRRALVIVLLLGLGYACIASFQATVPPLSDAIVSDKAQVLRWLKTGIDQSILAWLLLPFQWLLAPMFAQDAMSFLRALPSALGLLVLHYLWAVRVQVSFEEASIAHAQRRAQLKEAMKQGRLGGARKQKVRPEPFKLKEKGLTAIAFLWEELLALGPVYRLRSWLLACFIVFVSVQVFAAKVAWVRPVLLSTATVALVIVVYALIFAPMFRQYRLLRFLEQLDVLRSMPLTGYQVALGQLLSPTLVMSFALWLLLWTAAVCGIAAGGIEMFTPARIVVATLGAALLVLPLSGLMLCVPLAGALYFPAWAKAMGGGPRGVEVMGQRLIFMSAYMLALLLSLVPAAILAGLGFFLVNAFWGLVPACVVACLCAFVVLVIELGWVLEQFGERVEQFDVSQELR